MCDTQFSNDYNFHNIGLHKFNPEQGYLCCLYILLCTYTHTHKHELPSQTISTHIHRCTSIHLSMCRIYQKPPQTVKHTHTYNQMCYVQWTVHIYTVLHMTYYIKFRWIRKHPHPHTYRHTHNCILHRT